LGVAARAGLDKRLYQPHEDHLMGDDDDAPQPRGRI
jgi:hypothetical protein